VEKNDLGVSNPQMSTETAVKWVFANFRTLRIMLNCGENVSRKVLEIYRKPHLLIY